MDPQALTGVAGLAGPDLLHDLVLRHDAALMLGEHFEQRKLGWSEFEGLIGDLSFVM